jgi:hypothetical protein
MSKALEYGKAAIRLSLLSDGVEEKLSGVQASFEKMGKSLASTAKSFGIVGGAITAPFVAGIAAFSSAGSAIRKLSRETGLTVDQVQSLGFAAEKSGTDVETFTSGMESFGTLMLMAGRGSKKATATLHELGLSFEELKNLSPEDRFLKMADAVSHISDPMQKAALAQKVFGEAGLGMLNFLNKGSDGIKKLAGYSDMWGKELTGDDLEALKQYKQAQTDLTGTIGRLMQQLGAAVVGPLTDFLHMVQPILGAIVNWIADHRTLVFTIAAVGAGLAFMATAMGIVSAVMLIGGKIIAVVTAIWEGLAAAIGLVRAAILLLESDPIVLLIAALAAVVLAILYATGALGKLWNMIASFLGLDKVLADVDKLKAELDGVKKIDLGKIDPGAVPNVPSAASAANKQVNSFFDPKLVRQTIGADSIQQAQLSELKGIKSAIKGQKLGVPVK